MKILVIADIHGEHEKLSKILNSIKYSPDLVICPGDFTDMFSASTEFSQLDIANLVMQKLLIPNKPLFCVPGNHDPYEILEVFEQYGANLHNKTRTFMNVNFLGFGGASTPFNTIFEPGEEEISEALAAPGENVKTPLVLVVHNPPKDTKLDKVLSGAHVGSQAIRKFILKKKPILAISAHIHEATGTDKLGSTTLFYPGPAYDGYYGTVDIVGKKVKCESKKADV